MSPLPRDARQPGQLDELGRIVDQRTAGAEVVDDPKHALGPAVGGGVVEQQTTNAEVSSGPLALGQERVRGLPDPIMDEVPTPIGTQHEHAGAGRDLQVALRVAGVCAVDGGDGLEGEGPPEAGRTAQGLAGGVREQADAPGQEFAHRLAGLHLAQAVLVPAPVDGGQAGPGDRRAPMLIMLVMFVMLASLLGDQELLLPGRAQEGPHKQGIAGGALDDELRERTGSGRRLAEGLGDQRLDLGDAELAQGQLHDLAAAATNGLEAQPGRVAGLELLIAHGDDEQQVTLSLVVGEELEQSQGPRVGPLEVVEEDREWVSVPGAGPHKAAKYQVVAVLRSLWPQGLDTREDADDELELGEQVAEHPAVDRQRLAQMDAPGSELVHGRAQDPTDEDAEGLGESLAGRPAARLGELAADERARPVAQASLEFGDQRRLAHARAPRHQDDGRPTALGLSPGPLEHLDLPVAAEQALGHPQLRLTVESPQLEGRDDPRVDQHLAAA